MNGLILAAGAGRRLRPHTDRLPKALVPICSDGRSVLDETLGNFSAAGCTRVGIVIGYRGEEIAARVPGWESEHGVEIDLIRNDRAEEWNNAYSLWCARSALADGVLLANGDTLHPPAVTVAMLALVGHGITLAVDRVKALGQEEMKVLLDEDGRLRRISKELPHDADGEYIGVTRIDPAAAGALVDALERTWRADPGSFYEAAFQRLADDGERIGTEAIGAVDWIEIDDHDDLARARELLCRS